jgi:hypothetical protein
LAESGLFNGLQRIQIKKSGRASTRVSGCEQNGSTSQASIISGCQRIISKLLIFAKKNQSDPRRRANVLVSGPQRLELAASRWRFNTIAFFYHSYRYSLLLLAALTAIQRPLILALIDECSQGRWGAHGHRSIADLYEPPVASHCSIMPTELRERLAAPASSFCVSGTSTGVTSCGPA